MQEFIESVQSNPSQYNKCIRALVLKHVTELELQESDTFPYYYDPERAEKPIKFISNLKFLDDDGIIKKVTLLPWMRFFISLLYGWQTKEGDENRYRKAVTFMPRQQGKTFLSAGLLTFDFFSQSNAQSFNLAMTAKQANTLYSYVKQFIKNDPMLSKLSEPYYDSFKIGDTSELMSLASDKSEKIESKRSSLTIFDEVHGYKDLSIVKAITTGQVSRQQARTLMITSAGYDLSCPFYVNVYTPQKELLLKGKDNGTLFMCWELDDEKEIDNPDQWVKALPSLGLTTTLQRMKTDYQDNQSIESDKIAFQVKNLNWWTGHKVNNWLPVEQWPTRCHYKTEPILDGLECWGGLDLSKTRDYTAFSLCFPINGKKYFRHWVYIPENRLAEKVKTDTPLLTEWVSNDFITLCSGDIIDYNQIFYDILSATQTYNIQSIGVDPAFFGHLQGKLDEYNLTELCIEINPKPISMTPLINDYEKDFFNGIIKDNNPVMSWGIDNTALYIDVNNLKKINKKSDKKRIDIVITSLMAGYLAGEGESANDTYEDIDEIIW